MPASAFIITDPVEQQLRRVWATCAVCRKPVEKMTVTRDAARAETVFTAQCHGATETASVSDQLMQDTLATFGEVERVAFTKREPRC